MSKVRADSYSNKAGTGAPSFPQGLLATGANVTGVVTAASYQGDGSSLTGVASTDNIITSIASTFANINSTGIVTAVSFSGDGSGLTGVGGQLDVTSSLFI